MVQHSHSWQKLIKPRKGKRKQRVSQTRLHFSDSCCDQTALSFIYFKFNPSFFHILQKSSIRKNAHQWCSNHWACCTVSPTRYKRRSLESLTTVKMTPAQVSLVGHLPEDRTPSSTWSLKWISQTWGTAGGFSCEVILFFLVGGSHAVKWILAPMPLLVSRGAQSVHYRDLEWLLFHSALPHTEWETATCTSSSDSKLPPQGAQLWNQPRLSPPWIPMKNGDSPYKADKTSLSKKAKSKNIPPKEIFLSLSLLNRPQPWANLILLLFSGCPGCPW